MSEHACGNEWRSNESALVSHEKARLIALRAGDRSPSVEIMQRAICPPRALNSGRDMETSLLAVTVLAGWLSVAAAARGVCAELYIDPPSNQEMSAMMHSPEQWAEARQYVTGIIRADHTLTSVGDAELRYWFHQMQAWNLSLQLEVGAIKEWATRGDEAFKIDTSYWERAQRLGASIGSIAMDGPLALTLNTLHLPMEYAVEETVKFIALVRKNYPGAQVGDIEPFPGLPVGTHAAWIDVLERRLAAMGLQGLDFYRVDVNWIAFAAANKGSWREVKDIEDICHKRKLPFSLIYWASDYPLRKSYGTAEAGAWYKAIMAQGYAYAAVGGLPDQYVIESWIGIPAEALPETQETTFAGSALGFARRFVKEN